VADGKVVTLGVRGILSCLDAATGSKVWRKEDAKSLPRFFPSSSPIIVDGLCIVQFGGEGGGGIAAYELGTGNEKWTWTGDGTAYASPSLLTIDGVKAIVAETAKNIVAVGAADGKLLWQTPFAVSGRMGYNAATPVVEGQTILYAGSGRGTHAMKVEKEGNTLSAKEVWKSPETSVIFNTPIAKNGLVFGLSDKNAYFCIDTQTGKTTWTEPAKSKGRPGYGSILDAGSVMMGLTPGGQLVVFEPTAKEYREIASYKVGESDTYAYPVVSGNRIYVKDKDSVTLWSIE
jgi:outer membrane protein assembly factor BamB